MIIKNELAYTRAGHEIFKVIEKYEKTVDETPAEFSAKLIAILLSSHPFGDGWTDRINNHLEDLVNE